MPPRKRKPILEYFPSHLTPRDVQRNTLLALEKQWDKSRFFVINLPVASGKSAIAQTVAKWQREAAIVTPTKLLVKQYVDEYRMQTVYSKDDYWCSTYCCTIKHRPKRKDVPTLCPKSAKWKGS